MNEELYAEAILGRDAEDFIQSDLGKYLIGCAEQEAQDALEGLKRIDPYATKEIIELQNRIWRADSFQSWIAERIIQGKQAMQQLDED